MDLKELTDKVEQIKDMIFEITNKKINGNITFSNVNISFVIPPPFNPVVRVVARNLGIPILSEGIKFKARALSELDDIINKIEEFEVELERYVDLNSVKNNEETNPDESNHELIQNEASNKSSIEDNLLENDNRVNV